MIKYNTGYVKYESRENIQFSIRQILCNVYYLIEIYIIPFLYLNLDKREHRKLDGIKTITKLPIDAVLSLLRLIVDVSLISK